MLVHVYTCAVMDGGSGSRDDIGLGHLLSAPVMSNELSYQSATKKSPHIKGGHYH